MTQEIVYLTIEQMVHKIASDPELFKYAGKKVYGVPRGGVPVAIMFKAVLGCEVVSDASTADLIVDDVVATGETLARYAKFSIPTYALYNVNNSEEWLVFPWEQGIVHEKRDNAVRLLQSVGCPEEEENIIAVLEFVQGLTK